jgi:hypothetical protein
VLLSVFRIVSIAAAVKCYLMAFIHISLVVMVLTLNGVLIVYWYFFFGEIICSDPLTIKIHLIRVQYI